MIQQKAYELVKELSSNQQALLMESIQESPQHQSLMMVEVMT
jgi:hypothetical protein